MREYVEGERDAMKTEKLEEKVLRRNGMGRGYLEKK